MNTTKFICLIMLVAFSSFASASFFCESLGEASYTRLNESVVEITISAVDSCQGHGCCVAQNDNQTLPHDYDDNGIKRFGSIDPKGNQLLNQSGVTAFRVFCHDVRGDSEANTVCIWTFE